MTLAQIQQQVLDKDTVLLQYSLGEKQSYLWAVTATGIQAYTLPPKSKIEAAAIFFRNNISTSTAKIPLAEVKSAGDALFKLILAPAANQLSGKRLLIVGDGALQTIPFSALPLPNSTAYIPLLKDHEIVNAPSAASIAVSRQRKHPIGSKTLAVLADPVFQNDDKRLSDANVTALDTCAPASSTTVKPTSNNSQRNIPVELQSTLRSLNEQNIFPLPNTRVEAEKILALVPPDKRSASCAFAANYGRVMQPQKDRLDQYRIVHFATHGFVNESKPQFSGLVLSLIDSKRKPQNGFLRLHDIFNLRLAADLVVLSACETGLGKDIRGEGLVGLTRGFMYAGSRRVVTSLWNVNDKSTANLMAEFYRGMLQQKQPPAAALRAAQLKMWSTKPDPYLWAAFTLQGEWRP